MTKISNTINLKNLYILTFIFLCSNLVKAQPGWQDYTVRYFYTILDENGEEISFKKRREYSIMINNMLYKAPNIPQKTLKPAKESTYDFENQISINDFSLAIAKKSFYDNQKQLEIKIIHDNDTMFICQNTAIGNYQSFDIYSNFTNNTSNLKLKFIAGHYYFPNWTKTVFDNLPQVSENMKIINMDQRHFIIPKTNYDSVCYITRNSDTRQNHLEEAENIVVRNFMNGYFTLDRKEQPITFDTSVLPFRKPKIKSHFPTNDKDVYLGIVSFSFDTLNYKGVRGILVRYNFKENKMNTWSATDNLMFSDTYKLRKDPFNNTFYHQTIIRDSSCKEILYKCDFVTKFYRSTDEGKTWGECEKLTKLYEKHEIRELQFIDQRHAIIYKHEKIKPKNKKHTIQQGTYYLLENFRIIDSLKSPNDLHYNGNYNRYQYTIKNDTIFLGSWSYSEYYQVGEPYFQPILVEIDNKWNFQVVNKNYSHNIGITQQTESITYQNFTLANNKELIFENKESLVFKNDISDLHKKVLILENGSQIYLVGLEIGTLFSFDGGKNWYLYPLPLEKNSGYMFLEINEKSEISHLKNNWGKNGYELNKVFNQFLKLDE